MLIDDAKIGSIQIDRIYQGDTLIWQKDAYGPEMFADTDFSGTGDWVLVRATVSGGEGNLDSTEGASLIFQNMPMIAGDEYRIEVDVNNIQGNVDDTAIQLIDDSGRTLYFFTTNGHHIIDFTWVREETTNVIFRTRNGAKCSIDNASLKKKL